MSFRCKVTKKVTAKQAKKIFCNLCNLSDECSSKEQMKTEEQHKIERILAGKTEEFAYFLDTYGQQVFTLIVRMTGSESDAEELTQSESLPTPVFVQREKPVLHMDLPHSLQHSSDCSPEKEYRTDR